MNVFLYGASALCAIRHARTTGRYSLVPTERIDVTTPHVGEIPPRVMSYLRRFRVDELLHLRMATLDDRPRRPGERGHATTCALLPGSILQLVPIPGSREEMFLKQEGLSLYADAPSLLLCWFARELSRRGGRSGEKQVLRCGVALAMELMGGYSLGPDPSIREGEGYGISSVVGRDELREVLDQLHGMKGLVMARRALLFSEQGAASPFEALLYLFLALPPRLGGMGLSNVLLNHALDPAELERVGAAHKKLTPDLWIKDLGIVVECDSRLSHDTGRFARAHAEAAAKDHLAGNNNLRDPFREDRERTQDCAAASLVSISATAEDVSSVEALVAFGRRLSHAASARSNNLKYVRKMERLACDAEWLLNVRGLLDAFSSGALY